MPLEVAWRLVACDRGPVNPSSSSPCSMVTRSCTPSWCGGGCWRGEPAGDETLAEGMGQLAGEKDGDERCDERCDDRDSAAFSASSSAIRWSRGSDTGPVDHNDGSRAN